jgi:hypothetical protein
VGTRSHTYFVDGETPFACLYRQFDGYVSGHGHELAKFLSDHVIVDGHTGNPREFNGVNDLAVRAITALKGDANEVGGFYLLRADAPDDDDYGYFVSVRDDAVRIVVTSFGKRIFAGTPEELLEFVEDDD